MYWPSFFCPCISRHLKEVNRLCVSLQQTCSSSPLEMVPPRSTVINSMVPVPQVTLTVGGHCFCPHKLSLGSSTSESTSSPLPLSVWFSFPPLTIWIHSPYSPVAALLISLSLQEIPIMTSYSEKTCGYISFPFTDKKIWTLYLVVELAGTLAYHDFNVLGHFY